MTTHDLAPFVTAFFTRHLPAERKASPNTIAAYRDTLKLLLRFLAASMHRTADADGSAWTDQRIAEAFSCRTKTVENIRQRCVQGGFEQALERKRRASPPVPKLLDGEQEAQVIALRLGPPPKGFANWSLRLLARRVVELAIVESISHETIRRTLKKTA